MIRLFKLILDLLYPPKCPFCHEVLKDGEDKICRKCKAKLHTVPDYRREEKLANIELCAVALYYEDGVRDSLIRYKFHGVTAYVETYTDYLVKAIDENRITCDTITWVPISRRRYRKRGFDQSRLLAEAVSKRLNIPCAGTLEKTKNNNPQSGTGGPEKRRANVKGVYRCKDTKRINDKTVLIIDDIVTTGATLSECAATLKAAGAKTVYAAAVASTRH